MARIEQLRERLEMEGFAPVEAIWGDHPVVTGLKRTFKWRWFATTLWENVVVFQAKKLDVPELTAIIDQAKRWAIANKRGWMRGMQRGQAVVVIVLCESATDAARKLAGSTWEIEFARCTVVGITDGKSATCAEGPKTVEALYRPHLNGRLAELTAAGS